MHANIGKLGVQEVNVFNKVVKYLTFTSPVMATFSRLGAALLMGISMHAGELDRHEIICLSNLTKTSYYNISPSCRL
jgi:hypothetical protein